MVGLPARRLLVCLKRGHDQAAARRERFKASLLTKQIMKRDLAAQPIAATPVPQFLFVETADDDARRDPYLVGEFEDVAIGPQLPEFVLVATGD